MVALVAFRADPRWISHHIGWRRDCGGAEGASAGRRKRIDAVALTNDGQNLIDGWEKVRR